MSTEKKQPVEGKSLLEVKKSTKANLEQHRFLWLLMGCVMVFSVTFAVIEWTTFEPKEKKEKKGQQAALDIPIEIMVPFTIPEKKVVPPPPEAKRIVDILEIVEDEAEIEESDLVSIEDQGDVVEITDNANIVVEDIVDSGNTIVALKQILEEKGVKEARMCTLLLKPDAYKKDVALDYVAMEIPNDFIVGFGLDYDEIGRNLKDIYVLDSEE